MYNNFIYLFIFENKQKFINGDSNGFTKNIFVIFIFFKFIKEVVLGIVIRDNEDPLGLFNPICYMNTKSFLITFYLNIYIYT